MSKKGAVTIMTNPSEMTKVYSRSRCAPAVAMVGVRLSVTFHAMTKANQSR
jgi:hypothetical protein